MGGVLPAHALGLRLQARASPTENAFVYTDGGLEASRGSSPTTGVAFAGKGGWVRERALDIALIEIRGYALRPCARACRLEA